MDRHASARSAPTLDKVRKSLAGIRNPDELEGYHEGLKFQRDVLKVSIPDEIWHAVARRMAEIARQSRRT